MTAALLAVRIQVADFYGLAAAFLPLNLHIGVVHIVLLSQRSGDQRLGEASSVCIAVLDGPCQRLITALSQIAVPAQCLKIVHARFAATGER
jgi:hypothetical protein